VAEEVVELKTVSGERGNISYASGQAKLTILKYTGRN
jgi:hypothetical protein